MVNTQQANNYAARRMQAERNIKTRIDRILSAAAEDIAKEARGITLVTSEALFSQMIYLRSRPIIEGAETAINDYVRDYAKASITILGDKDTGATGRLLNSELFGKTYQERSTTYMRYFFNDVIKVIIAGHRLNMSQPAIESAVKKEFQDPYTNSIIDRANKRGANISVPSYGRGIYRSAYGNIVRNAQGVISIAWGREAKNYARRHGAIGFRVRRGSTYPCPLCDDEVDRGIHPMTDETAPFHVNCCCIIEYIYQDEE